jgi:putative DNA primase/helicase
MSADIINLRAEDLAGLESLAAAIGAARADTDTITRLAALPELEYDRVRESEAVALGVRVATLDRQVERCRKQAYAGNQDATPDDDTQGEQTIFEPVDPWPDPVDGAALLADTIKIIRRFVVCSPEALVATALWCMASWMVDKLTIAPILLISAPEPECGKSQLLTVVGRLTPRPLQVAGVTAAVLFRAVEKFSPTLLVDEIETVLTRDNEDLRAMFNAGHSRDSAFVIRCVGDDYCPRRFGVFGMKAVAGINADRLAETITSRSVIVQLRRKLPGEAVELLRHGTASADFAQLCRKLARWAADNGDTVRDARPAMPAALGARDQDNWEALTAIADLAGPQYGKAARASALKLHAASAGNARSAGVELLADIEEVFQTKAVDRITMVELVNALINDSEKPWATWRRGQPMTPRTLGKLLDPYGIKAYSLRPSPGAPPVKGYELSQFADIFERYLHHPTGA